MIGWFIAAPLLCASMWANADHHQSVQEVTPSENPLFKNFDSNQDGSISIQEHEDAIESMANRRRALFKAMDSNDDGSVSKQEAQATLKQKQRKRRDKKAQEWLERFTEFDKDGNGMISKQEAQAIKDIWLQRPD